VNHIEKEIKRLKKTIIENRRSGRTQEMIDEVIDYVLRSSNSKFVVFATSQDIASVICKRLFDNAFELNPRMIVGNSIEIKDNLIVFRGCEWKYTPSYKYQDWAKVFEDNSINDTAMFDRIVFLENELDIKPEFWLKSKGVY